MTRSDWFKLVLADYEDWLWLVQTGCCWLFETGCDQFKLVSAWGLAETVQTVLIEFKLTGCWNWLWPVQTGSCWLLKLVETRSNQFLLVVHDKRRWLWWLEQFKLVLADCWNWLVVQTGSCSLLKLAVTSWNWFLLIVETGSNKVKPVVTHCAWLVQTVCCWLLKTGCD